MRTNLIQSYMNGTPVVQQYNSDKVAKDFDVNKELANRTFIKPLPSNGHLVKNTIFDWPSEIYKDAKYNIRAFHHAVKGEANDHELGRLNDLSMKLGGLSIATYLFARKQTPLTKIMEFVGFGAFFGSMYIWPKLALQLPAYLIHGVNIRQEYEDSYGRKKMFYQDHQFIPWDLYSGEKIDREKMRKIALQNNTMWMLTSGFATPIMSGLICSTLASTIARHQGEAINKKADKLLANFSQEIKKYDYTENTQSLDKILLENQNKPITREVFDKLHSNLSDGLDLVTSKELRKDLKKLIPTVNSFNVDDEALDNLSKSLKRNFENIPLTDEEFAQIIPDKDSIVRAFNERGLINTNLKDFSEHSKLLQDLLDARVNKFIENNPTNKNAKKLKFAMKKLVHSQEHGADSALTKLFKFKPAAILTSEITETLKNVSLVLNEFKAKNAVLDKFAYIKTAQAPETVLANSWNDISESLLKSLQFTKEEISSSRLDREIVGDILRNKIEKIVSDDASYNKVVNDLQKHLSELQTKMAPIDGSKDDAGNLYKSLVNTSFGDAADSLRKSNMQATADRLVGINGDIRTSLKETQLSFVTDRIRGVKSSFYRILNMLDVYHRISKVEYVDALHAGMPRGVKEELVELCKQLLIEGHTSDYSVKFYSLRNPNIMPENLDEAGRREFYSQIQTKGGKVINKYFNKEWNLEEGVELANDKHFFESAMKLMYDGDIHPDTMAKIKDSVFFEDFMNYRKAVLNYIGGDRYFAKPNHLVNGRAVDSSSEFKFLLMGCAPDQMFTKLCRQKFNSNVWLKTFGKLGGAVLGVTVLSQFLMGRMKAPKVSKENN